MEHSADESDDGSLRADFDRRLKLEFHRSRITSGAGVLIHRELDGANPETYEFLEAEASKYTNRLPAYAVLQERIGWRLLHPVGRPPHDVRRFYASFRCQAGSWIKPRQVVTKVEWHPGELYPRIGFVVTNMARPADIGRG